MGSRLPGYDVATSSPVKMRARTTSQVDWWHARLTVVSLGGHASGFSSISKECFFRMQNHRGVVAQVVVLVSVVVLGSVYMHPCL